MNNRIAVADHALRYRDAPPGTVEDQHDCREFSRFANSLQRRFVEGIFPTMLEIGALVFDQQIDHAAPEP